MTSKHSVIFAEPVRTAIGTFGGTLKDFPAPSLGAVAIGDRATPPAGGRLAMAEASGLGPPQENAGNGADMANDRNRRFNAGAVVLESGFDRFHPVDQ